MAATRRVSSSTDPEGEFPWDPASYFFHLSVAINRLRDQRLDRMMRTLGSNLAEYRAMAVVDRYGPCTMGELSDFSVTDRTTLTRIVDGLVERNLVQRLDSPSDRRQVILKLTPSGRRLHRRAARMVIEANKLATEGLDTAVLRAASRFQAEIVGRLTDDPALADRYIWGRREAE